MLCLSTAQLCEMIKSLLKKSLLVSVGIFPFFLFPNKNKKNTENSIYYAVEISISQTFKVKEICYAKKCKFRYRIWITTLGKCL